MKYKKAHLQARVAMILLALQALTFQLAAQSYQSSTPPSSLSSGGGNTSARTNSIIDYTKPIMKTFIILGFAYCLVMVIWSYTTGHRENTKKFAIGLVVGLVAWFLSGAIFSDFGINYSF